MSTNNRLMLDDVKVNNNPYLIPESANKLASLRLSVIPVGVDKRPVIPKWKPFQEHIPTTDEINKMFTQKTYGIAVVAGRVSGNLEIIDEDLKYDLTGTMHDEFEAEVKKKCPGLYERLLIQKTVNGGKHYIYRCKSIDGNLKLAVRKATAEERKNNDREVQKTLYETRGEGGYFLCVPTDGYELIQGSFENIPEISPEEREILFNAARSSDQRRNVFDALNAGEAKKSPTINPIFNFENFGNETEDIKPESQNQTAGDAKMPQMPLVPPFPIEVFPLKIQEIIKATNESLNFPFDFISAGILYAASISIGNTFRAQVTEGWQESTVLFIANVGRPNTIKSQPLVFALRPIFEIENFYYNNYQEEKRKYDAFSKLSNNDRKNKHLVEPDNPILKKYTVSDYTPEALAEVLKFNKRGIGLYADELVGWLKNLNRYHPGSEQEFWLSVWSAIKIDIVRKTFDPILITLPFISVCGCIQTKILYDLAKDNRAKNGFIDRMLFAFPQGLEKPYPSEKQLNPRFVDDWSDIVFTLLLIDQQYDPETFNPKPNILELTPEAFQIFQNWRIKNTDLCRLTQDDDTSAIYGKFDIHVARFALILQMLLYACGVGDKKAVGVEAVNGAIKLAEYFMATGERVHTIISNINPLDKFPLDKRKLYEALPESFTTAEGLKISDLSNMPERNFKRFLNEKDLFIRQSQGHYEKKF